MHFSDRANPLRSPCLAALILTLALSSNGLAGFQITPEQIASISCREALDSSSGSNWSEARKSLMAAVSSPQEALESFPSISLTGMKKVRKLGEGTRKTIHLYEGNGKRYAVSELHHPVVGKALTPKYEEIQIDSLVLGLNLQIILSHLGFAPKIYGIDFSLGKNRPRIISEPIDILWETIGDGNPELLKPQFAFERIEEQVARVQKVLDGLAIFTHDLDLWILKDGTIRVTDFDSVDFIDIEMRPKEISESEFFEEDYGISEELQDALENYQAELFLAEKRQDSDETH